MDSPHSPRLTPIMTVRRANTPIHLILKVHYNIHRRDKAMVAIRLTWELYPFLNHNTAPLVPHKFTSLPLRQRRIYLQPHISINVGARMATSQPQDHLLIVSRCIRRAPVWILAAAATFTRRSLEFSSTIERATLQQLRHLRTGMLLLYMMRGTILVQKLPP